MKIGLVSSDPLYFPGGIQEHVKGLCNYFNSHHHRAKIIAPKHHENETYGKNVILIGNSIRFSANATAATMSLCSDISCLKELLEREKFDVLHFHNPGFFTGIELALLSDSTNILTAHFYPDASLAYKFYSPIIQYGIKKFVAKKINGVISISRPELKYLMEFIPDDYKGLISVIPNGVDIDRFTVKNKKISEFEDGKVNILFVGRIDKKKGLSYLIKAFDIVKRKSDDVRLIIVGDGYHRKECEKLAKKKNIKDIVWIGAQEDEVLPKYYATCDIFCSPAPCGEAFGIILIEAMASGKPVVAFANDGYKQVINDGYASNFLVESKNIKALAKALTTLVRNDELRKKLGSWGRKEAKKYSWDIVGNKVLNFYKEAMV